jgi:hypothetical protein
MNRARKEPSSSTSTLRLATPACDGRIEIRDIYGCDLCLEGAFWYIPDEGYVGPDSFTYTIQGADFAYDTALVALVVQDDGIEPDPVEALSDYYYLPVVPGQTSTLFLTWSHLILNDRGDFPQQPCEFVGPPCFAAAFEGTVGELEVYWPGAIEELPHQPYDGALAYRVDQIPPDGRGGFSYYVAGRSSPDPQFVQGWVDVELVEAGTADRPIAINDFYEAYSGQTISIPVWPYQAMLDNDETGGGVIHLSTWSQPRYNPPFEFSFFGSSQHLEYRIPPNFAGADYFSYVIEGATPAGEIHPKEPAAGERGLVGAHPGGDRPESQHRHSGFKS